MPPGLQNLATELYAEVSKPHSSAFTRSKATLLASDRKTSPKCGWLDLCRRESLSSVVQAMLPTACPLCYFEQERHGHPDPPFTWREHKLN